MFLGFIFYTQNLKDSEDTYHDKTIFVTMVRAHKFCDFPTEVGHKNQKDKYCYHERFSIRLRPIRECRMIWAKVFCLEKSKSTNDSDKKKSKNTGFWDSKNHRFCDFWESFFEHFERCEEDNEETEPLNRRIFFEQFCDSIRGKYHKNNRNNKSDCKVDDIPVACSGNGEDIVERHGNISDDDGLDGSTESICFFSSFFLMFMSTNLAIELPYNIEKKHRTEEFESWNLHEPDGTKRKNNSKDCCTSNSPKDCLFAFRSLEFLRGHSDKDSIVSAHDEIDEDDVQESKKSCGCKKMSKVRREAW